LTTFTLRFQHPKSAIKDNLLLTVTILMPVENKPLPPIQNQATDFLKVYW